MKRISCNIKGLLAKVLLLLPALWMMSACGGLDMPVPEHDESRILMTFTITLDESAPATRAGEPGTWGGDYDSDPGIEFESAIDFSKFQPLLFSTNEDGELDALITKVTPLSLTKSATASGGTYSVTYTFTGEVDADAGTTDIASLKDKGKARLMIIANADLDEIRNLNDIRGLTFTRSGLRTGFKSIPMWGVAEVNLGKLESGKALDAGNVALLRAMAKVQVTVDGSLGDKNVEIKKVELSRHNGSGYVAPGKWNEVTDTESLKFDETIRENSSSTGSLTFTAPADAGNAGSPFSGTHIEFYIPEIENGGNAGNVKLTVTYTVNGGEEKTGDICFAEYDTEGKLKDSAPHWDIVRNHIYRFTIIEVEDAKDKDLKIQFDVEKWVLESFSYDLIPNNVYLHVDKTSIEMKAGKPAALWYDTNGKWHEKDGKPAIYDCPKIPVKGRYLDLYVMKVDGDSLRISVNPAIPYDDLENFAKQQPGYNGGEFNSYFYIKAGNLIKKIDVLPLESSPFLTVTPQSNTIDVNERVSSGEYRGEIPITVETNLDSFRLDKSSFESYAPNLELYEVMANGSETIVDWNKVYSVDDGRKTFLLRFSGLNSEASIWKKAKKFNFMVLADNAGVENQEVNFEIIPMATDYMIHVKCNFDNPHIYIYQCLEFPADYTGTLDGSSLASTPIGFNNNGNKTAALEYSFTGKIAFKGWDYPDNRNAIYDSNRNPSANGYIDSDSGFFMFSYQDYAESNWNPVNSNSDMRYYKNMDFYEEYRNEIDCDACKGDGYHRDWPGIKMKSESDGWWSIPLTGIATPGKTLIIITNANWDHSGDNGHRYPGSDDSVGLPLFDFPSKEGWINTIKPNPEFKKDKKDAE